MMESKVKKSCDRILPTESEKQQMLDHILTQKEKRGFSKFWMLGAFFTTVVTTIFVITIAKQTPIQPNISVMRVANTDSIEYKGQCYEYVGLYSGRNLKQMKEQIQGGIVYQIKGQKDSIVIYQSGEYQHYQVCKGE